MRPSSRNLAGKVSRALDPVCRPRERRQVCNPTRHGHLGFDLLCLMTLSASFPRLRREDALRAFTWPATPNHILAVPKFSTSVLICLALSAALLPRLRIYCLFFATNLSRQGWRGEFGGVKKHHPPLRFSRRFGSTVTLPWTKRGTAGEPLSPCNAAELRRFGKTQLFRSFATLTNPPGNTRVAKVVSMGHSRIPAENSVSQNNTAELLNGAGGLMTFSEVLSSSQSNMYFLEAHPPRGRNHGLLRYPRQ